MSKVSNPIFLPGTTFKTRGRNPRLCTVIDVLVTYNLAGERVKSRYVATHELAGQAVTDYDVVETTIAMGLVMGIMHPQENAA